MQNYKGYRKIFLDLETTGLDRKKHHIFQLSGKIVDIDETVLEEFDFLFRPHCLLHVDESSFDKTGMSIEKLKALPMDSDSAFASLISILSRHCNRFDKKDKFQFIAYNSRFDEDFLREFFLAKEDPFFGSWFWTPSICVMNAAALFLIDHRGALPDFKLGTLCKAAGLGWEENEAHNANYDIDMTLKLFTYLRENMKLLGE